MQRISHIIHEICTFKHIYLVIFWTKTLKFLFLLSSFTLFLVFCTFTLFLIQSFRPHFFNFSFLFYFKRSFSSPFSSKLLLFFYVSLPPLLLPLFSSSSSSISLQNHRVLFLVSFLYLENSPSYLSSVPFSFFWYCHVSLAMLCFNFKIELIEH